MSDENKKEQEENQESENNNPENTSENINEGSVQEPEGEETQNKKEPSTEEITAEVESAKVVSDGSSEKEIEEEPELIKSEEPLAENPEDVTNSESPKAEPVAEVEEIVEESSKDESISENEEAVEETLEDEPIAEVEDIVEEAEATIEVEVVQEDTDVQPETKEVVPPAPPVAEPKAEEKEETVSQEVAESETEEKEGIVASETEESTPEEEEEPIDYTTFSREELVEAVEALSQEEKFSKVENALSQIVPLFSKMEKGLKETALNKFIVDGGATDDFEYRRDEIFSRFDASVRQIRDKKARYFKEREANKERNLEKKQGLLNSLRELVDGESASSEMAPIKAIQQEWRNTGAVPNQHNRTLWANYNALLDRFYSNRNILFELKELDRKKNQKLKEELCEKAEALNALEDVKAAIVQLNELHEDYKKVGTVPRQVQEELWQRFKSASDEVYKKRKSYIDDLKGELQENLVKKRALIEEIKVFVSFDSDRINDWNSKTKDVIAIQKKWEALGGLPREHAKEVNKDFWAAFKAFFSNKNNFFKKLEGQRKENLEAKQKIVEEARALQDNEDWLKTADKLKSLQRKWKELGPVPEKFRNSVYADFKEACDVFFNKRRANLNQEEETYTENLKKKEELCEEIAAKAKSKEGNADELDGFVARWKEIGFVPKNAIKKIDERYQKALEAFAKSLDVAEEDRESLIMKAQLSGLGKGPNADRNLQKKEGGLRRQIQELEDSINLWNNNLAFFANSKTADKLKKDFDQKIEKAEAEIQKLKKQLRVVRSI